MNFRQASKVVSLRIALWYVARLPLPKRFGSLLGICYDLDIGIRAVQDNSDGTQTLTFDLGGFVEEAETNA